MNYLASEGPWDKQKGMNEYYFETQRTPFVQALTTIVICKELCHFMEMDINVPHSDFCSYRQLKQIPFFSLLSLWCVVDVVAVVVVFKGRVRFLLLLFFSSWGIWGMRKAAKLCLKCEATMKLQWVIWWELTCLLDKFRNTESGMSAK